jgi:hypothetical protein
MRCLLRKAYVAAAVQDGKFVQEFRTGTSVDLHGIAFGGDRGIQKVELSFDKERAGRKQGALLGIARAFAFFDLEVSAGV